MKERPSLETFSQDTTLLVETDLTGKLKEYLNTSRQLPGCMIILCTEGTCTLQIHLSEYTLEKDSVAVIFPEIFCKMSEVSEDCRFTYILFSKELVNHTDVFTHTIEYTPYIFEQPVIHLRPEISEIVQDYLKIVFKVQEVTNASIDRAQASMTFTQIILGLRKTIVPQPAPNNHYCRNHEIVRELLRMAIQHYRTERNVSFYADKLHLSPQHLSTTVKKVTGKTLTEIISTLVIHDAQAKLRSSELTIQEIAYSLNFPDISFFGKYFKRYTGMSPKQYRKNAE
jgi:AraC family transcriptional activator of pobA